LDLINNKKYQLTKKMEKIEDKDKDQGGLMYQQLRKFIGVIDELRDVGL